MNVDGCVHPIEENVFRIHCVVTLSFVSGWFSRRNRILLETKIDPLYQVPK